MHFTVCNDYIFFSKEEKKFTVNYIPFFLYHNLSITRAGASISLRLKNSLKTVSLVQNQPIKGARLLTNIKVL